MTKPSLIFWLGPLSCSCFSLSCSYRRNKEEADLFNEEGWLAGFDFLVLWGCVPAVAEQCPVGCWSQNSKSDYGALASLTIWTEPPQKALMEFAGWRHGTGGWLRPLASPAPQLPSSSLLGKQQWVSENALTVG